MTRDEVISYCKAHSERTEILAHVKDVHETRDISEVAQMLSGDKWIAICATTDEPFLFVLGRIAD